MVWLKAESAWVSLVEKNPSLYLVQGFKKTYLYSALFLLLLVATNWRQERLSGQLVKVLPKEARACPLSLTSWANHLNFLGLGVLIHKTMKLNEMSSFKINIQYTRQVRGKVDRLLPA